MQRMKKCYERRGLRGTKIFAVGWHVPAALDHLAYQLILCKLHSDAVQRRAPLTSVAPKSVTVMTLLGLKNERALSLEGSPVLQEPGRDGITAPGVHVRTPWGISREMREGCECHGDKQNGENCNRSPAPTFLSLAGQKWEQK